MRTIRRLRPIGDGSGPSIPALTHRGPGIGGVGSRSWSICLAALLFAVAAIGRPVSAQEPPVKAPPAATQPAESAGSLTEVEIQARIAQTKGATDLSETQKTEILAAYQQALEQVGFARSAEQTARDHQTRQASVPAELEGLKAELASQTGRTATQPAVDERATLEKLTKQLADAEGELKRRQEAVKSLEDEADRRADRRALIPDDIAALTKQLEEAKKELGQPAAAGAVQQAVLARRTQLQAKKEALEAQIAAYDEERRFYDARGEILSVRRELANLRLKAQQSVVAALQAAVAHSRQEQIARQKAEAEAELARAPRQIQSIAEKNKRLTADREAIAAEIKAKQARLQAVSTLVGELNKDSEIIEDNIGLPGMAESIGPVMRELRARLSEYLRYERELAGLRKTHVRVRQKEFEHGDRYLGLSDLDAAVDEAIGDLKRGRVPFDPAAIRPQLRELLSTQRDLLDALKKDYASYSKHLEDLIVAQSTLISKAQKVGEFIGEHVLWIRSAEPIYRARLPRDWPRQLGKLPALGVAFLEDAWSRAFVYLAALLVLGLLIVVRSRARHHLKEAGQQVSRVLTDSFRLTPSALTATALLSVTWPIVLAFIGLRLAFRIDSGDPRVDELAVALGRGLMASALLLMGLSFLRQIARAKGLAEAHFRWNPSAVRLVRNHLAWYIAIVVPAAFVVVASEHYPDEAWRDSVGRPAFILVMLATAALVHRLLRPGKGIFAQRLRTVRSGWLYNTRFLWFPLALIAPAALALASSAGYHYTAMQLAQRFLLTIAGLVGVTLFYSLFVRWLFVVQRRLAIEQAEKKREAEAEARAKTEGAPATGEAVPLDEETLNLVDVGEQTKRLLRTAATFGFLIAFWFTWIDMLPALSFMEDVKLWSYEVTTGSGAGDGAIAGTEVRYITLAHLILAIIITTVTVVLAKNIPGLLEITILQRLPMDTGGRFAVTALARYFIGVVGVIVAFGAIGIGWSDVQWLAAAMTVGLAFGLQEIFANLVSGLMLLFERPIRVGDIVTVGNTSGIVTRIRIRATTITDWDRKDLVIPNKEFITGQVINWTLSDKTLRVVIPIGLAYGSDTDRAEQILLRLAHAHEPVMKDPPPSVIFMGFGDNTLKLELRVFVPVEHGLLTQHELNRAIDREFRKAGLEMAFPQRDIHIRSIQAALPIQDQRAEADEAARPYSRT